MSRRARLPRHVDAASTVSGTPRMAAAIALLLVAAALVQLSWAARLYPGGSWVDRAQVGYGLWHNFVCDLARDRGIDGRTNPGAVWGRAGQWTLVLALAAFWLAVPALFPDRRRTRAVHVGGAASTLGLLLVPVTFDVPHALALVVGGGAGCFAGALTVHGLRRRPALAWLGAVTFLLAAADLALYLAHRGYPVPTALTVLQRFFLVAGIGWMVACCVAIVRRGRAPG